MPGRRSHPVGFGEHYVRGLGLSARNNSLAYGYSVTITGAYAVLSRLAGRPSVADIFLFVVGASLPFAILNAVVTRGFRRRVDREPPLVVALGTSFSVVSASGAVGVSTLIAWQLGNWPARLLGSFAGAVVYLLQA